MLRSPARMRLILLLVLAFGAAPRARAASVLEVDLHELADAAELVFEGRVVATQVHTTPRGRLRTCFTLQVLDVLEGQNRGGTLELCFAGGKLGELEMRVGGMVHPKLGEHGIYFAEPTSKRWVHPLCGWEQGHFLLRATRPGDEPGVFTARGLPVGNLVQPEPGQPERLTRGFAQGVVVGPRALPAAAFKARFRALRRAHR